MANNTKSKHRSLSTTDDDSELLRSIMDRNNSGEKNSTGKNVFTREEFEQKSNLTRKKRDDTSTNELKTIETRGKLTSTSSRGILKNGSKRDYSASFKLKEYSEITTPLESPEQVEPTGMKTNLEIDSWSVASFDTCSGDVRRTYAKQFAIRITKWFTNAKSLSVFKNKQGLNFSVPMHENSHFEDDEPYGPHDPDSSFYKRKRKEKLANKRKSKMRRIKSFASFSKKGSPKRSKSTGGKSIRSRVAKISNHFSSRDSTLASEDMSKQEMKNRIKGHSEAYIPPDMAYDPSFNNGKGGLVNKEPEFLPPNKIWSKTANKGKGGIINKPPQPHTIPPGLIWSRSASNGQGGLVNCRPDVIPANKFWDFTAEDGMGALVDTTASYLLREKERKQKLTVKKRRKKGKQLNKVRSQGKIRISDSREELLRELNAENDKIFAEIDAEEEKERIAEKVKADKKLEAKAAEVKEAEEAIEEPLPPKYIPKEDDGSVLILEDNDVQNSSTLAKEGKVNKSSGSQAEKTRHKRPSFSSRRKSLYSSAKSVISESVKAITRKSIKLKKTVLLAAADSPANKEKAKNLGIEEGLVVKMFETFEAMSLRTDDAVRDFDSDTSSSSGSDLL